MNKSIFAIIVISGILLLIYINKPSGVDQELERQKQINQIKIDSLVKRYDFIIQKKIDSTAFFTFKQHEERYNKMEVDRNYWKRKANEERNKNRSFSDDATDSLLAEIR